MKCQVLDLFSNYDNYDDKSLFMELFSRQTLESAVKSSQIRHKTTEIDHVNGSRMFYAPTSPDVENKLFKDMK